MYSIIVEILESGVIFVTLFLLLKSKNEIKRLEEELAFTLIIKELYKKVLLESGELKDESEGKT